MKNIIVIGPPGSGKDTQIEKMSKYLDFCLVSTGDIVRKLAEKSEKIKLIMNEGGLVDDKIVIAEVDKQLKQIDKNMGVVFDGFPRNLHQAELLNETLLHNGRTLDAVVYINLEEGVIVERLTSRTICSLCGQNIPIGSIKCVICGGRPVRRQDDEPATVIKRVQTFLENTLPLISYYRNKGILFEVDGDQLITAVANDIKEKLEN
jgi:adenylate kinase